MKVILIFCLFALIGCFNADESTKATLTSESLTTDSSANVKPKITNNSTQKSPEPKPIPEIKAEPLYFTIKNLTDGSVCSIFNFTAKITLLTINETETIDKIILPLSHFNAQFNDVLSSCDAEETNLFLNITNLNASQLHLKLTHSSPHYDLTLIELESNGTSLVKNGTLIRVEDNKSYLCINHPEFLLNEQKVVDEKTKAFKKEARLLLTDLKIDAFRSQTDAKFRHAMQCDYDFPNNDFVPLAVGCALISLVFIVLIAYIVGRKRSRRLTYQSV